VSQLHKVGFELYNSNQGDNALATTGSYLACVGDAVAIQSATSDARKMIPSVFSALNKKTNALNGRKLNKEGGEYTHIRRSTQPHLSGLSEMAMPDHTRRANSVDLEPQYLNMVHKTEQVFTLPPRTASPPSDSKHDEAHNALLAASWTEDVNDSSVWTIVGTDCVRYTFYHPSAELRDSLYEDTGLPQLRLPLTLFPIVVTMKLSTMPDNDRVLTLNGRNFSRDLSVWVSTQCCLRTEFHSDASLVCLVPGNVCLEGGEGMVELPILLVRADGVVYRTGQSLFAR
jgi:hypothetical protein